MEKYNKTHQLKETIEDYFLSYISSYPAANCSTIKIVCLKMDWFWKVYILNMNNGKIFENSVKTDLYLDNALEELLFWTKSNHIFEGE